ncbi:MAG: hypothetical protein HY006_02010 [Candidatus Sungbacteria bacterium]|nr:hypothetical protein [Candidatus Sungbacteria bacterium]
MMPDKKLHSREHVLAEDLSLALGEPKRFAAYLGIAELYYEADLYALMRRVLEKADLPKEARGKYFFAALRGLVKKPGAKLKRQRTLKKSRITVSVNPVRELGQDIGPSTRSVRNVSSNGTRIGPRPSAKRRRRIF